MFMEHLFLVNVVEKFNTPGYMSTQFVSNGGFFTSEEKAEAYIEECKKFIEENPDWIEGKGSPTTSFYVEEVELDQGLY